MSRVTTGCLTFWLPEIVAERTESNRLLLGFNQTL
jgi:hypothetical protein